MREVGALCRRPFLTRAVMDAAHCVGDRTVPTSVQLENPAVLAELYRLYRDYFDLAEKRRRWSLKDDIPWDQCNRSLDPAVADVVQTFCSVELYLPDYLAKLLPQVRATRG